MPLPFPNQTPMGSRLLRSWVGKPLRHREAIEARLDAVQELVEQGGSGLRGRAHRSAPQVAWDCVTQGSPCKEQRWARSRALHRLALQRRVACGALFAGTNGSCWSSCSA